MPHQAYIVAAVRTPGGKRNGLLAKHHPADLGAVAVDELLRRSGTDPKLVDDVVVGCVSQVGAQSGNIGRCIVLASKLLPESCPATTVDRQCGSSQQAIHFAAQAVMSGVQDVVIAAGVEVMSKVPIGASVLDGAQAGHGQPFDAKGIEQKYHRTMFSQFEGAELLSEKYQLTREELDRFGAESHRRGHAATVAGRFAAEIVPVEGETKEGQAKVLATDEGIRPDTTAEKLAQLPLLKKDGGRVTAGTSSQITDGAAAVLICNERGLRKLGAHVRPRARIVSLAVVGSDPVVMLEGPIPATRLALEKANLTIDQIDLYEVNEAFAPVPVAWAKALKADLGKLNVNGGAIALGHPLGATGAKLMTTLLHELERRNGRYGLQAICEGGGTANATIIERIPPQAQSKL